MDEIASCSRAQKTIVPLKIRILDRGVCDDEKIGRRPKDQKTTADDTTTREFDVRKVDWDTRLKFKLSSQIRNEEYSKIKNISGKDKITKTRSRSSCKDNFSFTTNKSWPVAKKRKNLASSTNNHNRTMIKSKQDKRQVSDIVSENQIDDRMNIDRRFTSVRKNQNLEGEKIPRSKHKNDVQFLFRNFRFDDDDGINDDRSISQKSQDNRESDIVVHNGSVLADETFVV